MQMENCIKNPFIFSIQKGKKKKRRKEDDRFRATDSSSVISREK